MQEWPSSRFPTWFVASTWPWNLPRHRTKSPSTTSRLSRGAQPPTSLLVEPPRRFRCLHVKPKSKQHEHLGTLPIQRNTLRGHESQAKLKTFEYYVYFGRDRDDWRGPHQGERSHEGGSHRSAAQDYFADTGWTVWNKTFKSFKTSDFTMKKNFNIVFVTFVP